MKKILKSKKVLVLLIVVALAGLFSLYLSIGRLKPQDQTTYNNIAFEKDQFIDVNTINELDNNKLIGSNDDLELYFDEETTHFTIKDTRNNVVWKSNPDIHPANPDDSLEKKQGSTILIKYTKNKGTTSTTINNYEFSIHQQHYDGGPITKSYSIRYLDNAVQILYVVEKVGISILDFPQKISAEKMETKILANALITKEEKTAMTMYYKKNIKEGYYYLAEKKPTKYVIDILESVFYTKNGYTAEELAQDHEEYDVEVENSNPRFEIALEYRMTDDGFKASVISQSISEIDTIPMVSIDVLPYFGAVKDNENGYYVIPDGSGAILRFNNGKSYNAPFSKRYYGRDLSLLTDIKPDTRQEMLLPIYGVVNTTKKSAFLGIVEQGASMTTLNADVSGREGEKFNKISTSVTLREVENSYFYNNWESYNAPTWTKRIPMDIVYNFHFLSGDDANYFGIAKNYQKYLVDHQGLTVKDHTTQTQLNINMLGMFQRKEFFLGVPYNVTDTLTTFEESILILDEFKAKNVNNINLMYDGWFNDAIEHTIPTKISVNGQMGGKSELNDLIKYTEQNGIKFYPTMNLMSVTEYDKMFDDISYTAKHINGQKAMIYEYNPSTKLKDPMKTNRYLVSPDLYCDITSKMLKQYGKFNYTGIGINDLGNSIAGDYPKNNYTFKEDAIHYQLNALDLMNKEYDLMMNAPFAYSAVYANNILDVPINKTKLPILDESIPLYQLVFNGYIDYSGISVNENIELGTQYHKLKAIETGSNINFVFSYEDSSILLETDLNYFYSTNYRNWIDSAVQMVKELDELKIHESVIEGHEIIAEGVYKVKYENGNTFIINYNQLPYTYENNLIIEPESYVLLGGEQVE